MLAKDDMGLDTVLTEAGIIVAVEDKIKDALNLGGAVVWGMLTGVSQMAGENAFTLSKPNIKLPSAPKRDGDSIKSWASDCDVARSMNFKASLGEAPESVPVDNEQARVRGRPIRACRVE